jgi:broad specificity phosphatase PhoE
VQHDITCAEEKSMGQTTIWLVRHPETIWNSEGRYQGRRDAPLTPLGIKQAALIATRLARAGIQAVYSSPLGRALCVAERIAAQTKAHLHVDERLTEIAHGSWEGCRRDEMINDDLYHLWRERPHCVRFPGGETLIEVQARAIEAVAPLFDQMEEVAVVTHDAVIRVLLLAALHRSLGEFHTLAIPNASLTRLCGRELIGCTVDGPDVSHLGRQTASLEVQAL